MSRKVSRPPREGEKGGAGERRLAARGARLLLGAGRVRAAPAGQLDGERGGEAGGEGGCAGGEAQLWEPEGGEGARVLCQRREVVVCEAVQRDEPVEDLLSPCLISK